MRKTALICSAAALGVSLAVAFSLAGESQGGAEKHGGNIIFQVLKPTRDIKDHVLFSHELHLAKGATCKDCHNGKVFLEEKKMGANQFTMKDINRGKACGACHDGVFRMKGATVFSPTRNCARCHNVKLRK
jgi:c(7)-type cytochrome triheme protein